MPNYNYVIDSTFQPFTLQEMLVPVTAYKEAFEKNEEAYTALSEKADNFKYLSKTLPENSKARKIYEEYAKDLNKQAEDLAHNGLSLNNRRALTSLKRRYSGEIGRLAKAQESLDKEIELRRKLNAQDSSLLYATDNLNIDNYLDGANPNLYSISGNEIYTRGATTGKALSSRIYDNQELGSILNGYYIDYVQKNGYSPKKLAEFRKNMSSIPEFQEAADAYLRANGINQNLSGINLERAKEQYINGLIDGAIYSEQHSPQRDLDRIDAGTATQLAMTAGKSGLIRDENGNWIENPNTIDYQLKEAEYNTKTTVDSEGNRIIKPEFITGEKSETMPLKSAVRISSNGIVYSLGSGEQQLGAMKNYEDLKPTQKAWVDEYVGDYPQYYDYFEDTTGEITIKPKTKTVLKDTKKSVTEIEDDSSTESTDSDHNDE